MRKNSNTEYTNWQIVALTILRIIVGWHFLYEGLVKLYTSGWTSKSYLNSSVGPFSEIFKNISQNTQLLGIVDFLNEWGLTFIGLSLFVGLFSKPAKIAGIILLLFYYIAYPPFAGLGSVGQVEGSYWIVNKNLIEAASLFVLYLFPSSQITGLDRFLKKTK